MDTTTKQMNPWNGEPLLPALFLACRQQWNKPKGSLFLHSTVKYFKYFNSEGVLCPECSRRWPVQEKATLCNELQNEIAVS